VFNKHRTGSYGDAIYDEKGKDVTGYTKHTRRCLTEQEMQAIGMHQNKHGTWAGTSFEGSAFWQKEEKLS
jgi:hypothetical protein